MDSVVSPYRLWQRCAALFRPLKTDGRIGSQSIAGCVLGNIDELPAIGFWENAMHFRFVPHVPLLTTHLQIATTET